MAPSPEEHRAIALELLDRSRQYGYTSPARSTLLAEAQVEATLALFIPAPKMIFGTTSDESGTFEPSTARLLVTDSPEAPDTEPPAPAKPATKRRTRKPKPEAPLVDVVPGSEEDVIRKEASA